MNRRNARALLLHVAELLDRQAIPFFLMQGTALGAYRDQDFTPTEKDIDLGVLQEHFDRSRILPLESALHRCGYDTEVFAAPFYAPRTMVIWGDDAKLDLVGFTRWKDRRFTATPVRPWITEPYCLVHRADQLEQYEEVKLFSRAFNVPCPIETYLQLEYGPDWRTPADDHVSRTRVYNFLEEEDVPTDLLG